jgi:hypothetical protein
MIAIVWREHCSAWCILMPRPRRWRIPQPVLGMAAHRELARQMRPTDIDRQFLKDALGRRKKRTNARAIRAAGLYMISREVAPSPEHQARARLQDAHSHDWEKAYSTPGIPPYGIMQDEYKDSVDDVQDVIP